jgi:acyl-CoA synthetase (AMP-forming)/AMP-acid ligase II
MRFKDDVLTTEPVSISGLSARIRAVVGIDPAAPALEFEETCWPWSYLSGAVTELDDRLRELGLGQGALVGLIVRNRPESVRGITALLATNRCVTTLSSAMPPAALAEDIRSLALPAVLIGDADWSSGTVVDAVVQSGGVAVRVSDSDARLVVETEGSVGPTANAGAPGVAVRILTSGTTGAPKRVDLSYRSLEHEFESTASYSPSADAGSLRLRSGTTILWAPLLHIGGMRSLISSLALGRRIALMERFQLDPWRRLVTTHRPRVVSLVPTALRMVLDADIPQETFESVKAVFAGTAPVPPELAEEFYERYRVPVLVVYGATEFAGGVAGWTLRDWEWFGAAKRGSVGRANRGISLRTVDPETGAEVPEGTGGVLEVRGPQLGSDSWVRTTDLARIDGDGFVWILGRADDVIIRGGFKVPTNKVREVLASHPEVAEASVVGIPDERLGEVPVAAVQLKPDARPDADPDSIREFLRELLPAYQVPVEIRIVDELPRTPTMKVSQPDVKNLFAASSVHTGGGDR